MRFVADNIIQAMGRLEFEVGFRSEVLIQEGSGTLGVSTLSLFTATDRALMRKSFFNHF